MTTISIAHSATDWRARVFAALRAVLSGWTTFHLAHRQAALSNKLLSLSDAELAKRGFKRDQIPQFVANVTG